MVTWGAPIVVRRIVASTVKPTPASATCHSAAYRGFTLVELLVTVGIISVLAGILLSIVTAARSAGREAVCASNLRQIGLAYEMYVDDLEARPPSLAAMCAAGYIRDGRILHCPADPTPGWATVSYEDYWRDPIPQDRWTSYYYPWYTPGGQAEQTYWMPIVQTGPCHGIAYCLLHGNQVQDEPLGILFEGKVLRLTACGTVLRRHVPIHPGASGFPCGHNRYELLADGPIPADYPDPCSN